jgi:prepilin-type N-terminal cleavage/methylation domain-containing protein
MRPSLPRPGVTLVELLVSLMLLLVLVAIGAIAATRTLRAQHRIATLETRATAVSDALHTLTRHAADADPRLGDLHVARDTTLDISHPIGITTLCRLDADSAILGDAPESLPWSTALPRAVTTDDQLRIWDESRQRWTTVGIRSVGTASGGCGDSLHPVSARATQRVVLADSLSGAHVGAPVRVLQRERWSLVRGGVGAWALSMATWDAARGAFTAPQPLLAPLAPPSAAGGPGLTVRAIDALGSPLADSTLVNARSILVVLRAPVHPLFGALADSGRINVGAH